jgi:APA family basic amino acid/polyamine antiporter
MTVELKRQLGLGSATAAVVGEVIAVGIFLTPAGMAKALGSPFWILAVWLAMGAMVLCGALCYGELAARYPQAGGGYVYLREAFGPQVAFLYGWMCFLVMDPGITAALAWGFASYLGFIVPLGPMALRVVAISAILTLAAVHAIGIRPGTRLAHLAEARLLAASSCGLGSKNVRLTISCRSSTETRPNRWSQLGRA